MYYTIALLRYTSVEVRKVGGVGDSLAWAARLPLTLGVDLLNDSKPRA
jgi:hypothetical protein